MAKSNQKPKKITKIKTKVTKAKIHKTNLFVNQSNYKVLKEPKYALKTKTEQISKSRLVIGIKILLNTMSITSQKKKLRQFKQAKS